jgi:hypothetical protein
MAGKRHINWDVWSAPRNPHKWMVMEDEWMTEVIFRIEGSRFSCSPLLCPDWLLGPAGLIYKGHQFQMLGMKVIGTEEILKP